MTTVDVVFPKVGPPVVIGDNDAVCEDHVVAWHIKSENPEIARVRIEFGKGELFFPKRRRNVEEPPAHSHFEEELFDYDTPKILLEVPDKQSGGPEAKVWDTQVIWGRAPILVDPDEKQRLLPGSSVTCKYTVYGYGNDGSVLYELDPNIIISKP